MQEDKKKGHSSGANNHGRLIASNASSTDNFSFI